MDSQLFNPWRRQRWIAQRIAAAAGRAIAAPRNPTSMFEKISGIMFSTRQPRGEVCGLTRIQPHYGGIARQMRVLTALWTWSCTPTRAKPQSHQWTSPLPQEGWVRRLFGINFLESFSPWYSDPYASGNLWQKTPAADLNKARCESVASSSILTPLYCVRPRCKSGRSGEDFV